MAVTGGWTGRTACALQAALRMSNEAFAERLGIAVRTVSDWHKNPARRPQPEMQQLLDTALEQASSAAQKRFAELAGEPREAAPVEAEAVPGAGDAEQRLINDPNIGAALDWLDQHAGWQPGTARRAVASRLARLDPQRLQDRAKHRGYADRQAIEQALRQYYRNTAGNYGQYGARYGKDAATTSVLTHPEWLDLECPLVADYDRLTVASTDPASGLTLDAEGAEHAAQRLAETLAMGVRLVDMPLYRMADINVVRGRLAGSLGIARFTEYAVTMDLLEGELVDAIAAGTPIEPGGLPLRDRYLPDTASAVDVSGRLCSGGGLALCAIARPASPFRGGADYVLLVQERSGSVLNAARRLAVIPKAFHQPLTDPRGDAQIGATLRREMEEELFGRPEIDSTVGDQRRADPMHPSLLTDPMRWLMEQPDRMRMECTGFGLNLVSGNYEFAGLIVIDDEEFWARYGGQIEANWESAGLRQYSSLDHDMVGELVGDVAWSNEGLFALLQGLRRLTQIGGNRVDLPMVEWELG